MVANEPLLWINEVKTLIDNTPGQCCLFLDSSSFFQLDSHFFSTRLAFFFYPNFKLSTCVCSHDICLVLFFVREHIFCKSRLIFFYCIRCILQVSTYVLCFQHVLTIGIILSAMECHNSKGTQREYSSKLLKHSIVKHIL